MIRKNIALHVTNSTDGVVRVPRSALTMHVPVRSVEHVGRTVNVSKRLNVSDKTYSRLVYYSHLAHEDARVKRLRALREQYQKSTFEFMSQTFNHQFEDKLQEAKNNTTHDILHVPKNKIRINKLRRKFHI